MINPSVDFRPVADSHLFLSTSLTSFSCNFFGYCSCKGFLSKFVVVVLVLDL